MNYAFPNGKILNGTKDMQIQEGLCILVQEGKITDIVPDTTDLHDYTVINLHGHYILPGLINMHVHLAGSGNITGSIEKGKMAGYDRYRKESSGRSACSAQSGNGCHRWYDHRSSKDQEKKTGRSRAGQIPVKHMFSNHSSNISLHQWPEQT